MAEPPNPKDVADMLDALAKRIRADPAFRLSASRPAPLPAPNGPSSPVEVRDPFDGPQMGEADVFRDDTAVTVTVETRNADAQSVHVSLADGRLMIGLGDGPNALRRDLALPAAVDEEAAFATFRNGVLDVVLPLRGTVKGR